MTRYWITQTRHDSHGQLSAVRGFPEPGLSWTDWSKANMVAIVEQNAPGVVCTAIAKAGRYEVGAAVKVVSVGGKKYLRADANAVAADNLGALPTF